MGPATSINIRIEFGDGSTAAVEMVDDVRRLRDAQVEGRQRLTEAARRLAINTG